MKVVLKALFATLLAAPVWAQPSYREANTPAAMRRQRAALADYPNLFLNGGQFEVGYLYLLTGRRVLLAGLRYHVGQRLLEVQDSLHVDSLSYWPLPTLRGFDIGDPDAAVLDNKLERPVGRYRVRLVSEGRLATRREAVQVLTTTDTGPLLLAWLPLVGDDGRLEQVLLVGPGYDLTRPLRPLDLNPAAVLRLFGKRGDALREYARVNSLSFSIPAHVARIFDYYNRLVVAVEKKSNW